MPNGQVIQHPMWPPGVGPNRPVHPGPEPIHRPPWQGGTWPHPDWCDCGCDPCTCGGGMPNWSQDAIRCWNEMQQFRNMVAEIVQCELARMPGITGVTDGSEPKPGEVGEFIRGTAALNYAASPAVTPGTLSPLVVPPGDWDLFGMATITASVGFCQAMTTPIPAGLSDKMWVQEGGGSGSLNPGDMTFNTVRGNFSVPTLLPFSARVDQSITPGLQAGVLTLIITGRRRR